MTATVTVMPGSSVVELTAAGTTPTEQVKQVWCALAAETVAGLPARTVAELPGVLATLTGNVAKRPHPSGRRAGRA
jgi:hypothetical protein